MDSGNQYDWLAGTEWAIKEATQKPTMIQEMHQVYGTTPGKRCGTCRFLTWHTMANRYYKCSLAKMTKGPGTDWRKKWQACGHYQERVDNGTRN